VLICRNALKRSLTNNVSLNQWFSTFVRPRPGKLFFYKKKGAGIIDARDRQLRNTGKSLVLKWTLADYVMSRQGQRLVACSCVSRLRVYLLYLSTTRKRTEVRVCIVHAVGTRTTHLWSANCSVYLISLCLLRSEWLIIFSRHFSI
jgi:hypothetical protein